MHSFRPVVGITMGDPVGIGPEIILSALKNPAVYERCRPLVFGDVQVLHMARESIGSTLDILSVEAPDSGRYTPGGVDVLNISALDLRGVIWGRPTDLTGRAMVEYIIAAIDASLDGAIGAVVTCPINKLAMQKAGFDYNGHTELLAERTGSHDTAMMLAGGRLRVVLATIHTSLRNVPAALSREGVLKKIRITGRSLYERFGIERPRVAVAGLNPHAGEAGMFGSEEQHMIRPAVEQAVREGFDASGPYPPDTVFYNAIRGKFDAVVCMYHDQGLIPFKMIHFTDGVNTTLGLPIIRTSVDHGTAYDIAGTGTADPGSLIAAVEMAAEQVEWMGRRNA